MFLGKKIPISKRSLGIISSMIINMLLLYLFFFTELAFYKSTLLSLITAVICIILVNVILWRIGIYKKCVTTFDEKIFREFTENINEVFWRSTPDLLQVIYVSPAYDEIWGKSRENLFENPKEWFESIILEDQERVKNTLMTLTQKDVPNVTFEFRIKRPDGELRHIYTRGFKFKNKFGKLINILGISTDITRYKIEEKAKTILKDVKNILDRENSLSVIAPKVLKIICMARDWYFGEMWLVDDEENILRSISIWDNSEWNLATEFDTKSQRIIFRPGVTFPGEIWKRGQLLWVEDLDTIDLVRAKEAAQAGFHSAVGIPIFMNKKIIGVLDFFSHDIKQPDDILTNMLESICNQLGQFIEKKHTEDQVKYASRHDAQTSLLNQSALKYNLKKLLASTNSKIAILLIEIDRFKLISSVIGYEASDLLLKMVVERFRKMIPQSDDQLARYETNVFALYLPFNLIDELIQFTHDILKLFNEPFFINQEYIHLSANIGISTNVDNDSDIHELFKSENVALDESIKEGKNNYNFSSSNIPSVVHEHLMLETAFRYALNNNELCLYYQPKIDIMTGDISGVEALVRWQHPVKGLLMPADFIWLAEETGLIIQLDEWVLREVFTLIKNNWPMNPNGEGLISINISPRHFKAKHDIFFYIKTLMQEFNVNPKLIDIEITESVLLDDSQYNLRVLHKLVDMGFTLSLDDFGTGYNSLSYLLQVPVNRVKIDKSFINGLPDNKNSIAIVRAIITLCHNLNKKVIAEGVETQEQVQFLKQEGCDEIQGYYFSKPIPIHELEILLSQHKNWMY